jgi:hypothetical protein
MDTFMMIQSTLARDHPKLLDDGGQIPKFQERGWQSNSWL